MGAGFLRVSRGLSHARAVAPAPARPEKPAGIADGPGILPLGIAAIDAALGGGLARGALHEIAAASEAHLAAATGFALGLAAHEQARVVWIAEDMALAESGAPYGPGLDAFGLAPERLLTVAAARPRDLLWAMEEALRCRAVGAVIGELRDSAINTVALRRLSLAAARKRRARVAVARVAGGRGLHRRHALDRRRRAQCLFCRRTCPQPPRPARRMDSRME